MPAPRAAEGQPHEPVVVAEADETVPAEAAPVLAVPGRHRAPELSAPRRRPALMLAGALVAALSAGLISAAYAPSAGAATSGSSTVSVAQELGLTSATSALTTPAATDRLRLLAATRAAREAQQSAASAAQADADRAAASAAAAAAAEAARPKAVLPVNGAHMTTCFCMRWGVMHEGIDLAAPLGTPEYAAMDGVVLKAGPASGFGQAVYIQHQNGDVTIYGHMEKILVTAGQVVHAGDTIALLGSEGQSTGPHLHFEVHQGGIDGPRVDPVVWLAERGVTV